MQARPAYLDLAATLEKTISLARQAAETGAKLVCFGEAWLPGYPAWLDYCPDAALWDHAPVKEVFAALRDNSVTIDSDEVAALQQLAADLQIVLIVGVNEPVDSGPGNGTLYNSLLTIGVGGELLNHHRKLVPTYTERLVWGPGDARGLQAVEVIGHIRAGGLICWEHWMPLSRQVLHDSGEHIHVAAWPTVHDMVQIASRHYAFEGRCFVLAVGLIMRAEDLPRQLSRTDAVKDDNAFVEHGGSAMIGPDGQYLAGPVYECETILTADLDLGAIDREKMTLDVTGHYARPDLFDLHVRRPAAGNDLPRTRAIAHRSPR